MKKYIKKSRIVAGLMFSALALTSCQPDDDSNGNGIIATDLDATFSITQVSANRFTLTANSNAGVLQHFWDPGSGNGAGSTSYDLFLPDAGSYVIGHTVCGIGGECITESTTIDVAAPDPVAGNLIRGGKFDTAEDIAEWSIQAMSPDAHWTFANQEATLTSGPTGWAQEALYQAIEVEGGHEYRFDMKVKGPGYVDSVFELYADYQMPQGTGDYSAGGKVLSLNTWAGCATSPFEGQLFSLSCDSQYSGLKTFPTSGTIYVLVRGGGAGGNFNITIDNFEVRRND